MKRYFFTLVTLTSLVLFSARCSKTSSIGSDGTTSQIVAGSAGGTSNDNISGGSSSYSYLMPKQKPNRMQKFLDILNLFPSAAAAFQITCSGGSLTPSSYTSNTTYEWTPISCSLTYDNGRTTSVEWNSYFDFNYGTGCTGTGFRLATQPDNCVVTRTTPSAGNIRTVTRPDGSVHVVTVNTTDPSGWDSSITTTSAGTVVTATGADFATRQIVISGTQLVSTLNGVNNWNHTVSTQASAPLMVTGVGANKVISSGTVIVQHNLAKYDATSTITSPLNYTNVVCCFPTSGTISSTFSGGPYDGQTETIQFSDECGATTLTNSAGASTSLFLTDCL